MSMTITSETGTITSATRVSTQLILNIITNTPTIVVTAVTDCERLWLSAVEIASTSLVMKLITSPLVVVSKNLSGSLSILRLMSSRKR